MWIWRVGGCGVILQVAEDGIGERMKGHVRERLEPMAEMRHIRSRV